jgi:protein-L-isoaspartate(D-aspartate) O-methyltransferase
LGWPEHAPFDRIICGAGSPQIPPAWIDQLADGGRILAPVGPEDAQTLQALERTDGDIRRREICDVRFVKLIGDEGWSPPGS